MADIHDRMLVILAPGDYARWLGEESPQPLQRAITVVGSRVRRRELLAALGGSAASWRLAARGQGDADGWVPATRHNSSVTPVNEEVP